MLQFKSGVLLSGLVPEIQHALDLATDIFNQIGKDCIVTSARGGKHTAVYSRHYSGLAVDLRRKHLTLEQTETIRQLLTDMLGSDFTVILESTHFHVQYKPIYHVEVTITEPEPDWDITITPNGPYVST